jgi:hypothetical protein
MDNEIVLLQIMAAFTGVAAIALLVQMASLIGICLTMRRLKTRVNSFLDRWEPLADDAQKTLEEVGRESTEILKQVRELTVVAKAQVDKVDATLDALSKTTQLQAQKVDETVQILLERAQETSLALQQALLAPVKQIRAVGVGIAAMIDALAGRRRSSVDQATQDEEMFI